MHPPFTNDPLQILLAYFLEQEFAVPLDMLRVNDLGAVAAFDQSAKFFLSFNERGLPQIGIVQPKKIEGEKYGADQALRRLLMAGRDKVASGNTSPLAGLKEWPVFPGNPSPYLHLREF